MDLHLVFILHLCTRVLMSKLILLSFHFCHMCMQMFKIKFLSFYGKAEFLIIITFIVITHIPFAYIYDSASEAN